MKYQVIISLICGIRTSSCAYKTATVNGVCKPLKGPDYCCNNYEAINGICTECKSGMTTYTRGRCVSCKKDTYGYKCIMKCACNQLHRCDAEVGCVPKISIPTISTTYAGTTEPVLFSNERVTATKTTYTRNSKLNDIRTSILEWIMILTVCIISCFILTSFGCLVRTYIKQLSFKSRITDEEVVLEPLEPSPNIVVYDEIDENQLSPDTVDLNITAQESPYEPVDLVCQERISFTTISEHGDTEYLDPCFSIEEDENHQLQDQTSQEDSSSTNSSNSDVVDQDNTAYNNLYQPLHENWQKDSRGYEVPVIVHKCFENFEGVDEHVASHSYYNVKYPLQTYENQKAPESKAGNEETLLGEDSSSVFKTSNLHDYINMNAETNISMNNCDTMESCKPIDGDKSVTHEQISFHGAIDLKLESKNAFLNKICRNDDDNNSNCYEDAKSCV